MAPAAAAAEAVAGATAAAERSSLVHFTSLLISCHSFSNKRHNKKREERTQRREGIRGYNGSREVQAAREPLLLLRATLCVCVVVDERGRPIESRD